MKRTSKKILIVFVILFLFLLMSNNKVFAETSEVATSFSYSKEKVAQVLSIVNQKRAENGLGPLTWDYDLERAATTRAAESTGYFSHTRPDGTSCFTAINELEIRNHYSTNGENIAYGYYSAEDVMTGWMNSSGHRANILNANYNTIGVACTGTVWVQLFGGAYDLSEINSQKYVSSENQTINKNIKIESLYVEPVYKNVYASIGETKNASECFALRSTTYQGVRFLISQSVNANFSTNNSTAITIHSNKTFTMNDYDTYTLTAEVAGKTATLNVVGVKPNMREYVFNSRYYADKYADLKAAFGYNEQALKNHWETCGIDEGRQASPIISVKYYLNNNQDLKNAFGNNYRQAIEHFIACGASEKRKSSPEYWGNFYKKQYGDLANFSGCKLAIHYYCNGYYEGRCANEGYTPTKQQTTQSTSINNSWNGNVDSLVFDSAYYGTIYSDLRGMSSQELYNHWINFGINEGRRSSVIFDPKYYLENNQDLKNAFGNNYRAALEHYKACGLKEGRKSSIFFSGKEYLNKYSDLQNVYGSKNYAAATEHFVMCGLKEGRTGSSTFNVKTYKNNYADLRNLFGNNFIEYYNHYMAFGRNEGRKGI